MRRPFIFVNLIGLQYRFLPRIEEDFSDKMGLTIKSQARSTGEYHDIHYSFFIRAIREIRGFYFPIQVYATHR